jgi:hypothetical protein
VTKLEFLLRRWYEVDQARYAKLVEIRTLTGDDSWIRRKNLPGSAIRPIAEWLGLVRTLGMLSADIQREQQQPYSTEIVIH